MRKRGFTLIEIMVVVVIIGLLATFVGPRIWQMFARGQEDIAEAKCRSIHGDVKTWMALTKQGVPDDLAELEQPITRSDDEPFMKLEDDPWGEPYFLEKLSRRKFRICSAGPDSEAGTEDDICYPAEEEE
ncbi:MAG: prepilin-type N-terminal cleavage/methylation domain-containing protein [Planctomycetota bacterium]|jgi:general secretion pathway protein G